jgi:hypothetical protein
MADAVDHICQKQVRHDVVVARSHSAIRNQQLAISSFPLDGARWLGRDIEDNAVDAFNFVNYPIGDKGE